MPLEDYIPEIDNRRYDDIISEIQTRIARYTPEWRPVWSDLNDSDPGVTMVQVFAWLTEMLIFRMGKVPELNYLKFLQLLGIELKPAKPAITEITFPVTETYENSFVHVLERTQVAAETDTGEEIVFETDRPLTAFKAKITSVQVFDGYAYKNVSHINDKAEIGFEPFGRSADVNSALVMGFDEAFPEKEELSITIWSGDGTSDESNAQCGLGDVRRFADGRTVWEYWNGREWDELCLLKDETLDITRSGHVFLKTPVDESMQSVVIGNEEEALFWIRCRIKKSGDERIPEVLALRTNTVKAIQAETIEGEILGGSDGTPHQTFVLERNPVLHHTLNLEVDEGDMEGGEDVGAWKCVDDLLGSGPYDKHYVLNRSTGEIRFGYGVHGAIPVANVDNPGANVIAQKYRYGGGRNGNVDAKTIKTLLTSITGIEENEVTNLFPAHSGRDEETLHDAKLRAPQTIKNKCRAVTTDDFETFAKEASNIKRAKALPLFHPNFPGNQVPGVVTVIVVPDSDKPNPIPSAGTIRTVCEYLNDRRLLTTELYVIKPDYVKVEIKCEVIVENTMDSAVVKEAIGKKLCSYFHPITGGEDGDGWPFGGDIYYSRVFHQIYSVPGIQRIETVTIVADGEKSNACEDVHIPEGSLAYSEEHDVNVQYDFKE